MKLFIVKILFFFFKRSLIFLSKKDVNIKDEIDKLPENYKIILKIHNSNSPIISIKKYKDYLIENKDNIEADLIVEFKTLNSAFLIFTARKGLEKAFAEKRIVLKGLVGYGIIFTRISIIVQRYLFPAFICKNIMKAVLPVDNLLKIKLYLYGILIG